MHIVCMGSTLSGWRRIAVGIAVGLLVACPAASASAHGALPKARAAQVTQPVRSCASLAALDLSAVSAQVESAATATPNGVSFCTVTGSISPQTKFTVMLPDTTWRGSYLQQGCGGFCGHNEVTLTDPGRQTPQAPLAPLAAGEYVVAGDDEGHEGPGALWAKEDPIQRVVFGYRSEHDLALTAKAIIGAYYGRAPAYSYFDGHSDGGREALTLAQRYPGDFDGIVAGAPANNWAALVGIYEPWLVRANMDAHGRPILDTSKLPALHAAVMRACADAHGVIADPRSCTFDPATLRCPSGVDRADCLTPAQVNVVRQYLPRPDHGQRSAVRRRRALRLGDLLAGVDDHGRERPGCTHDRHRRRQPGPRLPALHGLLAQPARVLHARATCSSPSIPTGGCSHSGASTTPPIPTCGPSGPTAAS